MSFGFSISDAISLGQLAWNAVQSSRKACGEHDELTREVSSLHVILLRLQQEMEKPESLIIKNGDTCREELQVIIDDCGKVLRQLDKILNKYNALSEQERSGRKLWQKVRFGNGEVGDIGKLRSKVVLYTSNMTFYLNMVSMGAVGRIEQKMNNAGGILKDLQLAVNSITAHFIAKSTYEESVFTSYADDEKTVWREFRRELVRDGFSSSVIRNHKRTIMKYVKELGSRGLLDDQDLPSNADAGTTATARPPKTEVEPLPGRLVSPLSHEEDSVTPLCPSGDETEAVLESASGLSGLEEKNLDPRSPSAGLSTANRAPQLQEDQVAPTKNGHQAYAETAVDSDSDDSIVESIGSLSPVLDLVPQAAENISPTENTRQRSPADGSDGGTKQDAIKEIANDRRPPIKKTPDASFDHPDILETRMQSPYNDINQKGKSVDVDRQYPSRERPFQQDSWPPDNICHINEKEFSAMQHPGSNTPECMSPASAWKAIHAGIPEIVGVNAVDPAGIIRRTNFLDSPEIDMIYFAYTLLCEECCDCISALETPQPFTEVEKILHEDYDRLNTEVERLVLLKLDALDTGDNKRLAAAKAKLTTKTQALLEEMKRTVDAMSQSRAHQLWHFYHHYLAPQAINYVFMRKGGHDVNEALARMTSDCENIGRQFGEPRKGHAKAVGSIARDLLREVINMQGALSASNFKSWNWWDDRDHNGANSTRLIMNWPMQQVHVGYGPECQLCGPDRYEVEGFAPGFYDSKFWRHELRDNAPRIRSRSVMAVRDATLIERLGY